MNALVELLWQPQVSLLARRHSPLKDYRVPPDMYGSRCCGGSSHRIGREEGRKGGVHKSSTFASREGMVFQQLVLVAFIFADDLD